MPKAKINFVPANDTESPAANLAEIISNQLEQGRTVLWLVSGGSSIGVAVKTCHILGSMNLGRLHVGLIDERYGPPGHGDSNWQRLIDSGFDTTGLHSYPVLSTDTPIQSVASAYNEQVQTLLAETDYTIGLLGIGVDGHTAGLLPDSPLMDNRNLFDHYRAPDFWRISATPKLIGRLNLAMVYAAGRDKWPALETLLSNEAGDSIPAQVLNRAAKLEIFSDYEGEPK